MNVVPKSLNGFFKHAGIDYLSARGISYEQAIDMGIQFLSHAEADRLAKHGEDQKKSFTPTRDALWVPTIGPDGEAHPYHGQAIYFNPGKPAFKLQPPKNELYPYEANYLLSTAVTEKSTIYWCESSIKAAILKYHFGLNAIGLNGVQGFTRSK